MYEQTQGRLVLPVLHSQVHSDGPARRGHLFSNHIATQHLYSALRTFDIGRELLHRAIHHESVRQTRGLVKMVLEKLEKWPKAKNFLLNNF
jgi:hypothetical protein